MICPENCKFRKRVWFRHPNGCGSVMMVNCSKTRPQKPKAQSGTKVRSCHEEVKPEVNEEQVDLFKVNR